MTPAPVPTSDGDGLRRGPCRDVAEVVAQRQVGVHMGARRGRREPRHVLADVGERGERQEPAGHEGREDLQQRAQLQEQGGAHAVPLGIRVELRVHERRVEDAAQLAQAVLERS